MENTAQTPPTQNTAGRVRPAKRQARRQKVPAFARYKGTSAWKKYRQKARNYLWHRAQEQHKQATAAV